MVATVADELHVAFPSHTFLHKTSHPNTTLYSAIHKAAVQPAAVQNMVWRAFQLLAPFTAYGDFRNCTRQNHGTAGNREAGGFVNSAVTPNGCDVTVQLTNDCDNFADCHPIKINHIKLLLQFIYQRF